VLLFVLMPLSYLEMGSIIKLFYTQERVGKDGVVFSILNSGYEE
jgi:hypothetical protein